MSNIAYNIPNQIAAHGTSGSGGSKNTPKLYSEDLTGSLIKRKYTKCGHRKSVTAFLIFGTN